MPFALAHDASKPKAAQTGEHYEIARYGTLIAWANQLGVREASKLLGETLDEENKDRPVAHAVSRGEYQPEGGVIEFPAF